MIVWDEILQVHDIRIKGLKKTKLDKYFGDTKLQSKNATAEETEEKAVKHLNKSLADSGYHAKVKIFTFPKKDSENIPFSYRIWVGPLDAEPVAIGHTGEWWEILDDSHI